MSVLSPALKTNSLSLIINDQLVTGNDDFTTSCGVYLTKASESQMHSETIKSNDIASEVGFIVMFANVPEST